MINLLLLSVCSGALVCFLDKSMDEGMINNWYFKLIDKLPTYLYNPLGGCIYCFNFWVTLIITLSYYKLIFFPLIVGISHLVVTLYDHYACKK
jgi:hypothetical protein